MAEGKILGIPRPLVDGELMIESALAVTDDYGALLEDDDFRVREEDKIEQILSDSLGLGKDMRAELSPAGNIVGIKIALAQTEIVSHRVAMSGISIPEITDSLNEIEERIQGVTGFRVPGAFGSSFGEMTPEPRFSIRVI